MCAANLRDVGDVLANIYSNLKAGLVLFEAKGNGKFVPKLAINKEDVQR